jgi:hypothetical protein
LRRSKEDDLSGQLNPRRMIRRERSRGMLVCC